MIYELYPSILQELIKSKDWSKIEVYMGDDDIIHFRALRNQAQQLENIKAMYR